MKKLFTVLLAVLLLASFNSVALAVESPPINEISLNPYSDYGSWSSWLRSDEFKISYTSYGIQKTSSTSVFVAGTTETSQTANCVAVLITVQQWKNNGWSNYSSISSREYSSSSCQHSGTVSVASGYYYRIKVLHSADNGSKWLELTSYSKSILIE